MKLPEFILAHNRMELPGPVILQTVPPYVIAKVHLEKTDDAFAAWLSNFEGPVYVLQGYKAAIYWVGSLHQIPTTPQKLKAALQRAAEFYKTERLEYKPGFYKKYAK